MERRRGEVGRMEERFGGGGERVREERRDEERRGEMKRGDETRGLQR